MRFTAFCNFLNVLSCVCASTSASFVPWVMAAAAGRESLRKSSKTPCRGRMYSTRAMGRKLAAACRKISENLSLKTFTSSFILDSIAVRLPTICSIIPPGPSSSFSGVSGRASATRGWPSSPASPPPPIVTFGRKDGW